MAYSFFKYSPKPNSSQAKVLFVWPQIPAFPGSVDSLNWLADVDVGAVVSQGQGVSVRVSVSVIVLLCCLEGLDATITEPKPG